MLKVAFVLLCLAVYINAQCTPSCINGVCTRSTDANVGFYCKCTDGWSGKRCGRKNQCVPRCKNGLCDPVTSTCTCDAGYTGVDCGTVVNQCTPNRCTAVGFEKCTSIRDGYICQPRTTSNVCVSNFRSVTCVTN